jgi:hypothetical protein
MADIMGMHVDLHMASCQWKLGSHKTTQSKHNAMTMVRNESEQNPRLKAAIKHMYTDASFPRVTAKAHTRVSVHSMHKELCYKARRGKTPNPGYITPCILTRTKYGY